MVNDEINLLTEKAWENRLLDIQQAYKDALMLSEWSESINYKKGQADSAKILGYCYWRFSDYSLSLSNSLNALNIYEKIGDKRGVADTLNNIGAVYMFQNDNEKRLEVNLKCKQIRQEIGDLEGVCSSEGNIGETYFEMGDLENAELRFNSVLTDVNASPQGLAWAHYNLGRVAAERENWEIANYEFRQALTISIDAKYDVLITESLLSLVKLFLEKNELSEALDYAEKALDSARLTGAKEEEKRSLYYLSKIYEIRKQFETSLKYHKDFHSLDRDISRDTEIERLKTAQLKVAFDKIEDQKNELIESIRYAKKIQEAVLTRDQQQTMLNNYAVYYEPKDIVSGDFYWYHEKKNHFYLGVADCTGHGVPGALLTMLGITYLNEIITPVEDISPADFLDELRKRIIQALSYSEHFGTNDGMDISLLKVNSETLVAEWSGANNPIWIVRKIDRPMIGSSKFVSLELGEYQLVEFKADKQPIGKAERILPFKNHRFQLEAEDVIYMFSDGFADQFGGQFDKKYKTMNFKRLILENQNKNVADQLKLIESVFFDWKGNQAQVDDVCVFAFQF